MTRLQRYLVIQLARPVIGVFFVVLVIVLAFYLSRYLADAVVERLSIGAVARLALLKVGLYLDVLIPSSVFLGVVIGLGRLQSGYEITALAAAGVGRAVVVRAVMVIALVGLVLVAGISHGFRPWAYELLYRMEGEMIARVDLARVEPGRFEVGDEQWMIFAERRVGNSLSGVMVHQRLPTYRNILKAQRLEQRNLEDGTIALDFIGDVRFYRLDLEGDADLVNRSNALTVLFDPPPPVERTRMRRALSLGRLVRGGGALEWGELQWRTIMPLTVLLLSLTALSIARINPRAGQTGKLVTASLIVALYFSILGMLAERVDAESIPIWPGLFWLPLVMLPILAMRFWRCWRGPGAPI
ncbi:MAG: LptF/LptG family permease [Xanthomonadaceae bacterium]|nr:LptF/LptG family permease [Xanthomonadaceae bacterium]